MRKVTFEIPDNLGAMTFPIVGMRDKNACDIVSGAIYLDDACIVRVLRKDSEPRYSIEAEVDGNE